MRSGAFSASSQRLGSLIAKSICLPLGHIASLQGSEQSCPAARFMISQLQGTADAAYLQLWERELEYLGGEAQSPSLVDLCQWMNTMFFVKVPIDELQSCALRIDRRESQYLHGKSIVPYHGMGTLLLRMNGRLLAADPKSFDAPEYQNVANICNPFIWQIDRRERLYAASSLLARQHELRQ